MSFLDISFEEISSDLCPCERNNFEKQKEFIENLEIRINSWLDAKGLEQRDPKDIMNTYFQQQKSQVIQKVEDDSPYQDKNDVPIHINIYIAQAEEENNYLLDQNFKKGKLEKKLSEISMISNSTASTDINNLQEDYNNNQLGQKNIDFYQKTGQGNVINGVDGENQQLNKKSLFDVQYQHKVIQIKTSEKIRSNSFNNVYKGQGIHSQFTGSSMMQKRLKKQLNMLQ